MVRAQQRCAEHTERRQVGRGRPADDYTFRGW